MANNYKVKMIDLQNKYKFKIFCSSQMYDDSELKREVEAIYKAFPKASATGTSVNLTGTAAAIMNIDLKGNGGKNLFGSFNFERTASGVTAKVTGNNINFNGTSTGSGWPINTGDNIKITLTAGTYTLSVHNMSGNVSVDNTKMVLRNYNTSSNIFDTTFNSSFSNTFTLTETTDVYLRFYVSVANVVYTNYNFDVMIEKGSTATDYEHYDASVTGDNTIDICGKNLAQHMSGYIIPSTGVFKSSNDDCFYFPVVEGETYYCSSTGNRTIGAIYDSIPVAEQTCIQGTNINNVPKNGSFVASATGIMVVYANTPTSQSVKDTFMVIKGNTAPATYEPYTGKSYPINLGSTKLKTDDSIQGTKNNWNIVRADGTIEAITDATLITQLNNLRYNAESYEGQTNISQVNDDLPFIITASAIKDLSNL